MKEKNCFDFLDEWAAGKKREPDVINNPNKMVRKFGRGPKDTKCKTCKHLVRYDYHNKNYYKCSNYGYSKSIASDFRLKFESCGKYEEGEQKTVRDW